MGWRELSRVLVRETAYRASRKFGSGVSGRKYFLGGFFSGSMALGILFMSFLSVVSSVMFLSDIGALPLLMGALGLLGLFFGAFAVTAATNTILSEDLLKPISFMPVDEWDLRIALLLVGVYLGGASVPFLVIPGVIVASLYFKMWGLIFWGLVEAFSVLLLAFGIGYIAGSLGGKYTRSLFLRGVQTAVWLVFLSLAGILQIVPQLFPGASLPREVLDVLPPFSFGGAVLGLGPAILSSVIFVVAGALVFWYGVSRLWRMAGSGLSSVPVSPAGGRPLLRSGFFEPLLKDLKLLARNPRMLAYVVYYMNVVPLMIIFSFMRGSKTALMIPSLSLFMAGFAGADAGYFYVAEGEGSLLLYVLPVTRGWLARRKAATCLVFSLPTMAIIATLGYVFGEPSIAVTGIIIFLLGAIGSSLAFSFLAARGLPRSPAVWTYETLREGYAGAQIIGLLFVIGLFLVSAFPVFVSESQGFHSSLLMALSASIAFFLVGLATIKVKDEPL